MATRAKLTLEEFLAMPESEPASEYIDGEVIQKQGVTKTHGFVQGYLFLVLFQFLSRTGLGRTGTEVRCIFGPPGQRRAFVPDVVFIARERLTDDEQHHAPPDLAVEVLSPGQPMGRFASKVQFYMDHGVRMLWIVDPVEGTITVLTPGEPGRTLGPGDTLDGGDVLPGFSVPVDEILAQARG